MILATLIAVSASSSQVAILPNGLEIVAVKIPGAASFSAQTFVRTGSAYEAKETNGANHLLEHMLFRGGKADSIAENAGALLNATTYREMTRFFCEGPTAAWREGLRAVAAVLEKPSYSDLSIEGDVVAEESALRGMVSASVIDDTLWRAFGGDSAWALPPVGDMVAVKSMKGEALQRMYDDAYVGANIVLAIAGDFEPADAVGLARNLFGSVPGGRKSASLPPMPALTARRLTAPVRSRYVAIGLAVPGFDEPENYVDFQIAFDVLAGVGGMASQEGLEAELSFGPSERGSLATVIFRIREGEVDVEAATRQTLDKMSRGPSAAEFADAKRIHEARHRSYDRSPADKAMLIGLSRFFTGSEIDWHAAVSAATRDRVASAFKKFAWDQVLVVAGK